MSFDGEMYRKLWTEKPTWTQPMRVMVEMSQTQIVPLYKITSTTLHAWFENYSSFPSLIIRNYQWRRELRMDSMSGRLQCPICWRISTFFPPMRFVRLRISIHSLSLYQCHGFGFFFYKLLFSIRRWSVGETMKKESGGCDLWFNINYDVDLIRRSRFLVCFIHFCF